MACGGRRGVEIDVTGLGFFFLLLLFLLFLIMKGVIIMFKKGPKVSVVTVKCLKIQIPMPDKHTCESLNT